ncbi:DNA polymerase III subunit alpha [Spongisporangium articulatum]|uniref:DNA polymerase III subunit alpha n=1 Tax=Spongisporangium articulatum TaxID=3362603 RepID=A0ABW8ATL5_9ACTN
MSEPFVHLHVASGYSLRHGATSPGALVARAAELGMDALALTDRDGLYGAVKFVQACEKNGVAPILGVDLAVEPLDLDQDDAAPRYATVTRAVRKAPVRGGAAVDPRHPRVTVLALADLVARRAISGPDDGPRPPGVGWARLCRLVSAAHARGERGTPVADVDLVTRHAAHPEHPEVAALVVLLGPASDVGRALLAGRPDRAAALLRRWRALLPAGALAVEVVNHRGPRGALAGRAHAVQLLTLARQVGVPAVLTNVVRHLEPDGAVVADVLDAARRLVPLNARHLDSTTAEGYLAGTDEMVARAVEIADALGGGGGRDEARLLLAHTRSLAMRCRLVPKVDLGLGSAQYPELHTLRLADKEDARRTLRESCEHQVLTRYPHADESFRRRVHERLDQELGVIEELDIPEYFLAVQRVCELIRDKLGGRVAARGSGAGSLVNYLLNISGVDPLQHRLLMERFLTTRRAVLPDIDLDVESHRREDIYREILREFGDERVTCVSMMDTYRVRHAVRDVGAALGLPPGEVDTIAKAFPHIRAKDARFAVAELPELRSAGLDSPRLQLLFELVERLDGLPRHIALHPCGVVLSNAQLLDRTPVEASWQGFPMSQFDKDDVELMGMIKLDVLGIRMQSAMAHAVQEVERLGGPAIELDDIPLDDEPTFEMIRSTRTLGCFQIESPGQRELIGKFGPETFDDLIIDISLYRPGPVQSDMITPFLRARQGFDDVEYLHPALKDALESTAGVVVFHEQVIEIIAAVTGCPLDVADEARRAMGSPQGQATVREWLQRNTLPTFDEPTRRRIWDLLVAFASFGFCKAHAAAFALPTYQSAWLKTHHPAAFLAGVLTHDPGMYPKRLILDDARNLGIAVLPLDVNASDGTYRVERVDHAESGYGIRLSLADVKGISDEQVASVVANHPYHSLADFWQRAEVDRPVVERLVLAGGFDSVYGLVPELTGAGLTNRTLPTRRDLLLQLGDLDRWTPRRSRGGQLAFDLAGLLEEPDEQEQVDDVRPAGGSVTDTRRSGLPELTDGERLRIELDVLGLDASRHVMDFYAPMLESLGVTRAPDLLSRRSRSELLVAGVKVATQTPPIRGGRRVVFLTLDDSSGPVDATFFEDVQGHYAGTVFHSWLLLVRGVLRKAGRRGVSLRATGAWELPVLWEIWSEAGRDAVLELLRTEPGAGDPWRRTSRTPAGLPATTFGGGVAVPGAPPVNWEIAAGLPAGDRAALAAAYVDPGSGSAPEEPARRAGGMGGGLGHTRVLVHASGFRQSPYADLAPPGDDVKDTRRVSRVNGANAARPDRSAPRKLWHSSPGSSGG